MTQIKNLTSNERAEEAETIIRVDLLENKIDSEKVDAPTSSRATFEQILKQTLKDRSEKTAQWAKKHPVKAGFAGLGLAVCVVPGLVVAPALAGLGLGAAGPIAGGIAAAIQGPAVAAGSAFAVFQSAAMGGAGLAVVNGVVTGTAAAALGAGVAKEVLTGEKDDQKKGEKQQESQGGEGDQGGQSEELGSVLNERPGDEKKVEEEENDEDSDADQDKESAEGASRRSKL